MVPMVCQAAKVMTPISGANSQTLQSRVMKQQGFTLLELLIVLSIIVLASAIIIPSITGTESNVLAAQIRQTASAFNYARRIAIVKGAPQVVTLFQMDPEDPDYPESRGEIIQQAGVPILEQYEAEILFQADINEEPEVLDIIEIIFFPQGGSTGGILNFSMADLSGSVQVDPITGRVSIYYPGEEIEEAF